MRAGWVKTTLSILGWVALPTGGVQAEPLDLADTTPRWIEVRFEVSPEDAPGRLDGEWSAARPAFLEPTTEPGQIRIRVPADEIEAHLLATGTQAVPGTFSEFVWQIEATTGHVVHAELSGRVRQPISLGLVRSTAEVAIRAEMTTRQMGGFRPRTRLFGQSTHGFCESRQDAQDCTLVPSRPLDPQSGYVNAVGSVTARIPLASRRVFSPLGEARFSERTASRAETAGFGPSSQNAVCSGSLAGACGSDLGGRHDEQGEERQES
ncbi:MAG: hypothetical protein JRG86_02660 [Deltaproteobacteria bacterium]|nr:hypothetical protein [Deltaproteobacteria bacterium]